MCRAGRPGGIGDDVPVPGSMRPWKLAARQLGEGARYLEHDPALRRGSCCPSPAFPAGLKIRARTGPGYGPNTWPTSSACRDLRRAGWSCRSSTRSTGVPAWIAPRRFDEASWGPSSIFTEADSYLYELLPERSGRQPQPRADSQLDEWLEAQRRVCPRRRRASDHRRHPAGGAAHVYYVHHAVARGTSRRGPRASGTMRREPLRPRRPARGGLARPGLRHPPGPFRG